MTFQSNLAEAESTLWRANCWLTGTISGVITSNNDLLFGAEITGTSEEGNFTGFAILKGDNPRYLPEKSQF